MEYAVNIYTIARDYHAKIHTVPFQVVDGMVIDYAGEKHIGVRSDIHPLQRSWVVAHELAHIKDETIGFARSLIAERRADRIARETLISAKELKKAIEDYGADFQILSKLFGVPEGVMERRIQEVFML